MTHVDFGLKAKPLLDPYLRQFPSSMKISEFYFKTLKAVINFKIITSFSNSQAQKNFESLRIWVDS
jgi:hypothetical protein